MAVYRHIVRVCLIFLLSATGVSASQQMEFVREIGASGKETKQRLFNAPQSLCIHGDRLYVADTENHRIVVLDKNGAVNLSWGAKGNKPGQFRWPAGIAADDQGRVYVADAGNNRVQVFDAEGKWLRLTPAYLKKTSLCSGSPMNCLCSTRARSGYQSK